MKKTQKKELEKTNHILGILFVAVLLAFFVVNLVVKDRGFSESENRSLSERPVLSWQSLASGTFTEDFETYESDQFVGRRVFREMDVLFRRAGGDREENGVFRGKRRQLMEDIAVPDDALLAADITGLNRYAQAHPDIATHVLLVPDAAQILDGRLPAFVRVADQKELFATVRTQLDDGIIWMDGIAAMQNHAGEKLYYQTDSRWTTLGAYRVFLETASLLGIEDPYLAGYDVSCAAGDFNGALSAASGFCLGLNEEIDVYLPIDNISYLVTYVQEGRTTPSLYIAEKLDTRDKYAVFLDGDHPLVEIDTAAGGSRVLLVVKDSFANCYIPFLIPYYDRIIVVDPDVYSGGIDALTESYGVTDTLFLYSGNTFFTDTALSVFLAAE